MSVNTPAVWNATCDCAATPRPPNVMRSVLVSCLFVWFIIAPRIHAGPDAADSQDAREPAEKILLRLVFKPNTRTLLTHEVRTETKIVAAGNSLRIHDGPIDLAKLQESIKTLPPAAADGAESGGTYEFPLNKRGGGIRIVSGAKPPRLEFYDDYGDGVEVTWKSDLSPKGGATWQTDRNLVVRVEKLAKPWSVAGKRCDWKLKISGKNPGFREHQKVLPQVDFGDPENSEYLGTLAAE